MDKELCIAILYKIIVLFSLFNSPKLRVNSPKLRDNEKLKHYNMEYNVYIRKNLYEN